VAAIARLQHGELPPERAFPASTTAGLGTATVGCAPVTFLPPLWPHSLAARHATRHRLPVPGEKHCPFCSANADVLSSQKLGGKIKSGGS